MKKITWKEFEQVELRVGTIISARDFPEAQKKAYKLEVDFGEEIGIRKSSAQITHHYNKEELTGKQVIGVVNFPAKQIGPFMSECLITGFYDESGYVLLAVPDRSIKNGTKLG
ncbi:MAG: tRNA-binding protein [Balneolales bacterium]|nr:tRNA-binding protein [Balneolales bacterium]